MTNMIVVCEKCGVGDPLFKRNEAKGRFTDFENN